MIGYVEVSDALRFMNHEFACDEFPYDEFDGL